MATSVSRTVEVVVLILCLCSGVELFEATCSSFCRNANNKTSKEYELSLDCNIPSIGAQIDITSNDEPLRIHEMYLECKTATTSMCTPVFQERWNGHWRDMYETVAINTSLIQECQLIGCYGYNRRERFKFVSSASCSVTGITVEFEDTTSTVPEGHNTSVCFGLRGQTQIPSDVRIEMSNTSIYVLSPTLGETRVLQTSDNYERRCVDIYFGDDDKIMEQEIVLELSVSGKETVRLGDKNRTIISIVENDAAFAFERNESVIEGQNLSACVRVTGQSNVGFRLILNSTEPDKYLVGEKKIVYSSRDFELHCAEIEFIDDDVLQGNVELGISIESDSNYTVSTNHMTITVLDNDAEVMLEKSSYLIREDQGVLNVCIVTNSLHNFTIHFTTQGMQNIIPGVDYILMNDTLEINSNRICKMINIIDDHVHEPTEQLEIQISSLDPLVNTKQESAIVSIIDDDELVFSLETFPDTIIEGDDNISICIHLDTQAAMEINYNIQVQKYNTSSIEINSTFPITVSTKCHSLDNITRNDSILELDELINITVSIETEGDVKVQSTQLTISDDDKVTVGFTKTTMIAGHSGEEYCIVRNGEIERPIEIHVIYEDSAKIISHDDIVIRYNDSRLQCFNLPAKAYAINQLRLDTNESSVILYPDTLVIIHPKPPLVEPNILLVSILSSLGILTSIISIALFTKLYYKHRQRRNLYLKHYDIRISQSEKHNENDAKISFDPLSSGIPQSQSCITKLDELERDEHCTVTVKTESCIKVMGDEDLQKGGSQVSSYFSATDTKLVHTSSEDEKNSVVSTDTSINKEELESGIVACSGDFNETPYIQKPSNKFEIDLEGDHLSLDLYESESLYTTDEKDNSTALPDCCEPSNQRSNFTLKFSKSFDDKSLLKTSPRDVFNRLYASHQNISKHVLAPHSEIPKEAEIEHPVCHNEIIKEGNDSSSAPSVNLDIKLNTSNDGYVDCSDLAIGSTQFGSISQFQFDDETVFTDDTVLNIPEHKSETEICFSLSRDYV